MTMPAAGSTLLFALDDPMAYCSSPPGFNVDNDRKQTIAGHLRSSVVELAANGLPLLEHVPLDEIRSRNGTMLTFDTSQPLDETQLNRMIKESMHAFRTRRNAGRSAALTQWDLSSNAKSIADEFTPPAIAPDIETVAFTHGYYQKWL